MRQLALAVSAALLVADSSGACAQVSNNVVKIGVLNDQSGLYADLGGPGSVTAARMAAEDAGGSVLGKPIEIVFADHQNKADVGAAVARRWFENENVDMAIGFDDSAVARSVLARMLAKLEAAAAQGAALVVFPECALPGYCFESLEEARPYAETVPGPATNAFTAACKKLNVHAVFGMLEADGERMFNACVLVGPGGVS